MSEQHYTPVPVSWDDKTILRLAGDNPETIKALLRQSRQRLPSSMAIYQWISRGRIANTWRPAIIYSLFRDNRITAAQLFRAHKPSPDAPDLDTDDE